ncbi:MAG: lipopolysaccharide heptosyltransferase II [Candidatus Omnitrophica bacterium CG12_big_fil_rev_8_21_14_0_65_43_15]|uniref:lipopolysaccharide heptosyltransferase II n=1 Tax=Candidatus Taenaricola geysiri TaxID=1974752 RepID=A0A2J0LJ13_9BACT|nr:MAG: lipopolysaccharide heptosyltransferase II [Candidatus Omnitrophica bacterium CG1_02_43_210]PIR65644.1 MAG: lipopolysaccharide heptosyltransferase II [Candidatus Omnitrophica bacterium CG10_big_fil_rev_8_21_14_0_10_43_8]PIV11483.1 MAG: lipopolysaccharide heptosyltransferase II [Candidatus Omnitrophica bacterium CG03_land_8_20_14_0_80_43_22]PIW66844.1 MAG: lipopolysaccharide heptosyltransferase II [Candidatus Omnitrophica bacterium CG12_big_fil_rev_8_21_14_0_65_43_15]PIW80921.1 MAG: lipop
MQVKRILIAEVNWLGDVLFSTPFIRAVRNNFPDAHIACMIMPRIREILEGNPYINEIITYDEKNLKKRKFDMAFLLHRSFSRALAMYMAGIPERIGYYTFKRSLLLTEKPKPPDALSMHRAEFYLGLAKSVGLKTDNKGCDFFISKQDSVWAATVIQPGRKTVIFNPGGNWMPKRWSKENFIELGRILLSEFKDNIRIVLSGSAKDVELAQEINSALQNKAIITCGKTTLKQSAALFKKSDLVISADSGPLHIAVSVGAKAIAIFGPTSLKITGPYKADKDRVVTFCKDMDCRIPCYNDKCADYKCMAAITPKEVFETAKRLL